jgi:hypothetical protein
MEGFKSLRRSHAIVEQVGESHMEGFKSLRRSNASHRRQTKENLMPGIKLGHSVPASTDAGTDPPIWGNFEPERIKYRH